MYMCAYVFIVKIRLHGLCFLMFLVGGFWCVRASACDFPGRQCGVAGRSGVHTRTLMRAMAVKEPTICIHFYGCAAAQKHV